jgi:AcrR family transcriptional regulator
MAQNKVVNTKAPDKPQGRGRPRGSNAREEVIAKAGAAFVQHGYHGCTVEHILEATGVSRTNFYRFFKNKEAVFEAIFADKLSNLGEKMDSAKEEAQLGTSAEEKIAYLLNVYLQACFSIEDLLSVIIQESESLPQYREIKAKAVNKFAKNISRIVVEGGYQKPDPLLMSGMLAAIDRIMLTESQTRKTKTKKISHSHEVCMRLISLLFS